VSREVDFREKELTHQVHRVILSRSLESIKTLAPILICAMKIYVQLVDQGILYIVFGAIILLRHYICQVKKYSNI